MRRRSSEQTMPLLDVVFAARSCFLHMATGEVAGALFPHLLCVGQVAVRLVNERPKLLIFHADPPVLEICEPRMRAAEIQRKERTGCM